MEAVQSELKPIAKQLGEKIRETERESRTAAARAERASNHIVSQRSFARTAACLFV